MRAIRFATEAYLDLRKLRAHDRVIIMDAIERHLADPNLRLGRRVKLLRLADGEFISRLRVGEHRVFFEIVNEEIVIRSIRHKGRRKTEEIL